MAKRDYYEVLGVSKTATDQEIKRAYRKLAKQYHPDISQEANAEEKFKEAQEAYDVLSDEQKRAGYDRYGHAGAEGFGGGGQGFGGFGGGAGGFEDIFESMFGGGGFGGFGGGGFSQGGGRTSAQRGQDLKQSITLTFEEAAFGVTKEITVNRDEECTKCGGSGARSKDDIQTCGRCHGQGHVTEVQNTILGRMQTQRPCPECHGSGKQIKHKCDQCHGRGVVNKSKTIEVKVPAGIDDGQQIRLSGQGEAGRNGGPAGDLYVAFRVRAHDFFVRDGFDLRCEVPVTYSQAVLGAEIEVPTLTGKVVLKVPEGTQPGTEFRVRDKGIKYINREMHGDLYVKIKLIVPKKVSSKQRELLAEYDQLEDKSGSLWDKVKKAFK